MKRFPKRTVLFREGDPGAEMYILGAGRVEIVKRIGGIEKTIAVLGPGEMLGELALLNDTPRTATAVAVDNVDALVLDRPMLESMIANQPEFTMRLIRRLADRLDMADGLVRVLMHPEPGARELVLQQAETAKAPMLDFEMEVQGEIAGDPARVKDMFFRLNRLRARLRESTPDAEEMPRPFTVPAKRKGPQ